jgi:hypothetical protein
MDFGQLKTELIEDSNEFKTRMKRLDFLYSESVINKSKYSPEKKMEIFKESNELYKILYEILENINDKFQKIELFLSQDSKMTFSKFNENKIDTFHDLLQLKSKLDINEVIVMIIDMYEMDPYLIKNKKKIIDDSRDDVLIEKLD